MEIGVLFDLDGVLVDSESLYTQFWSDIDKEFSTGVDNFAYVIKGNNLKHILNTYFNDKRLQNEILQKIDDFEADMKYDFFPGAIEFLEELNRQQIPTALVTSSDKLKMQKLYQQHPYFSNYFKAIITGDMVEHSKPNPECFLRAAQLIGVAPDKCFVFEDSPSGIKAGMRCGARVIALATTLLRKDIDKNVNLVIDSFLELTIEKIFDLAGFKAQV